MNRSVIFLLFVGLCAPWACAQTPKVVPPLQPLLEDSYFQYGQLSVAFLDLENDSLTVAHNHQMALPTASVLKILTTASALKMLGPESTFKTEVGYTGEVEDGLLKGDLIVSGEGDPSWASAHLGKSIEMALEPVVEGLRAAGIKAIAGDVVGDASIYSKILIPKTWPYQDMGNYYGAFCAGLNFADNMHYVHLRQQQKEGVAVDEVEIDPEVPNLHIESLLLTGPAGSGDQAYIMGAPFQHNRFVQGTIPPGRGTFTIKGAVPDPALFVSHHLYNYLLHHGISVQGTYAATYQDGVKPLKIVYEYTSKPLSHLAKLTNEKSINLFAEGLGLKAHITPEHMKDFWHDEGVDMTGTRVADFAGLAPDNAVSAQVIVDVLQTIYDDKDWWKVFRPTLAVAGESGTMRSLLRGSPARGKVYAKSGLISGVRNYAGYMKISNRWYAFCVMSYNAGEGQQLREKLAQLLETLYLVHDN